MRSLHVWITAITVDLRLSLDPCFLHSLKHVFHSRLKRIIPVFQLVKTRIYLIQLLIKGLVLWNREYLYNINIVQPIQYSPTRQICEFFLPAMCCSRTTAVGLFFFFVCVCLDPHALLYMSLVWRRWLLIGHRTA